MHRCTVGAVSSKIWHRRCGVNFLIFWHRTAGHPNLDKQCLKVRLKNFNMSQCDVCAKVKMINQIFHRLLINYFIRFFYKINIDWKNLNEKWNNYQFDEMIVKWIMKIVYQITNMIITYFIFIWKENENLSLIQNLIVWMFFHYNFNIKIVHNNREMKRNQTRQYLVNVNIFFEPSSVDTQTQNGVTKRFERMMMMKIEIMQLFINLFHSMWKKIIGTTIYFYN